MAERRKRVSQNQDVPVEEKPRNYSPRGIAALLAPVLRPAFKRRAPAAAALLVDWPQLAGPELAARAAPVKFAAGTLTLACTGPTAMELQMGSAQIISRLNLSLGHAMIERLRFVQQAPGVSAPMPKAMPRAPVPPPPDLPEGPLGEALAKLYQGIKSRG
ncbi:hypothetical protein GCM10010909_34430 [Acidocella aquatica]|uniref:DUF721 domain-containing protein n=1 Tax=Acidocella aquatica TaxID=1922313 RepID=A0ABQ6AD90_9PROT|nr:DUF721 domain-containing protein [Acidocella aquatica]GLR68761.1 hypothetical protein GCM10010909_34430 [Acidocella aquatica]